MTLSMVAEREKLGVCACERVKREREQNTEIDGRMKLWG